METTLRLRFVAADDASRSKGLMYSRPLKENEAVLFIFANSQRHTFWNRNVAYPIDVAFLDDAMKIVDIKPLKAHQERSIEPINDARYVIEASHNYFNNRGFNIGDIAVLDNDRKNIVLKFK